MRRAALAVSLLALPSVVFAEAGLTSGQLLTRTLDARAAGLAQALTADFGDISDVSFNPAGIARLSYPVVNATYQSGLLDDSLGALNYARDTKIGGWFVGASALDAGKIDLNQSDGTIGSRHAEQDVSGVVGIAVGRNSPLSLGVAAKFLHSELAQTADASTVAGDAGLLWKTPLTGFQLAAAIQNLGNDLKYDQAKDSLPTAQRVGASYVAELEDSMRLPEFLRCRYLLLVDGVKAKDESFTYNTGLEIRKRIDTDEAVGWAALRGGYIAATKTIAVGIGFDVWNVSLDYALNIVNDIDNTHRFTLGYHFAPKPETTQHFLQ